MRLFIAIEIPSDIRDAFSAFLHELRAIAPAVKWVRADNLHVTLKFLGNADAPKLDAIENVLKTIHNPQPVTLTFRGLGFFPNEQRPRVFWTGMEASPNLEQLADETDRAMHRLGFPLETRPFTPHLTLARFDPPGLPVPLAAAAKRHALREFGSLAADTFHLIESKLKPTGAEYTTRHSFHFV